MLQFGDFLPDLAADGNPGLTVARNVLPRSPSSYGPMAGLSAYSSALTARCQGAISVTDNSGNANVFAGDVSKLYRLVSGSTSFSDVSKVGGYACGSDQLWSFVVFGNRVIAMNVTDPIQSFVMGTSALFADLAAAAPKARYAAVVRDFVVFANIVDAVDGSQPQRVHWPAIDDPTNWPTIGSASAAAVQSDRQDLLGDGGWNQGIVGGLGTADGAIIQEHAVWRMTYVGPKIIFAFDRVEGARGSPAPGSIVQLGALCYYLGEDGFYAFDGSNSRAIGAQKVDKYFFADVDTSYLYRVTAAIDPLSKLVFWSYPGAGSSGGTPNKMLIYNWSLDRWSQAEVDCEMLARSLTFGYTLDGLDAISSSLDALPASLDSRLWTGGRLLLGAFDTAHKLATFTGANLEALIETGEFNGDGSRVFVTGLRPRVDGGTVTAAVGYRDTQDGALTYTTESSPNAATGICPQRISARYARARVKVAAGGTWNHVRGVDPTMRVAGLR